MTKEIPLTQGQVALVNDEDYERLSQQNWYAKWDPARNVFIAKTRNGPEVVYMHRIIMDAPKGRDVDHRNHDTLDNRRDNLRICTCAQNQYNQVPQRNRSSAFKGVYWRKDCNKWRAKIQINCRRIHLGNFESEIEAARAYDKAAVNHFGEFAYTNIRDNELVILGIV